MAGAAMDKSAHGHLGEELEAPGLEARLGAVPIASLRYFDAAGPFAAGLAGVLGGALPEPLRAVRRAEDCVLTWRSPTETILLGSAELISRIGKECAGRTDGCIVDQTGGVVAVTLRGERTADLLVRLGSTAAVPAVGDARTGRLAELSVMSVCTRPGEIMLLVERVYARHLMGWIRETIADF